MNIMIADDDLMMLKLLRDIIQKQGYHVLAASSGREALDLFFSNQEIDLVILDVMMPIFDGWEVLKEIRAHSDVPVLMLTALGDELHEIQGLTKGADDYIAKPFSYEVLVARINALLRKVKKDRLTTIVMGNLSVDQATHKVYADQEELLLNNKEYKLLLYLVRNPNLVLTREQILYRVWGYDFEGEIRIVDAHVKMLRSKLGSCSNYIKTVRGSGYAFEVEQ